MKKSPQIPLAYLITFTCYGTRLHGDEAGSVDRQHNVPGSPFLPPNPKRVLERTRQLSEKPHELTAQEGRLVLEAIRLGCASRGWNVHAIHVRTAHVHLVVAGEETPERIMTAAKAYATRALNRNVQFRPAHASIRAAHDSKRSRLPAHDSKRPNPPAHETNRPSSSDENQPRKWWTRHGSTRYLWQPDHVNAAIHYVVEEQGEPMAVWSRTGMRAPNPSRAR